VAGEPGKKTVWVIGAGASKSHTNGAFPTLLELSRKAAELGLYKAQPNHPTGRYAQLMKYVRRRFGTALDDADVEHNLELVYTTLELDILTSPDPELAAARTQILRLLRQTVRTVQSRPFTSAHEFQWLASNLNPRDTIVTFNWDVLLDNALRRRAILKDRQGQGEDRDARTGQYWNFVFNLTAWGEATIKLATPPPPHTTREWDGAVGYYLKAHGSIDWYYCSNQLCRSVGGTYPVLDTRKRWFCGSCHEAMQLLLVPPTLNKGVRDVPLLRRVWTIAARELSLANEVVVWGYSLPPTDFFSDWLLRQARTKNCSRISVIDPSVATETGDGLNGKFVDRFLRDSREFVFYRSFGDFQKQVVFSPT